MAETSAIVTRPGFLKLETLRRLSDPHARIAVSIEPSVRPRIDLAADLAAAQPVAVWPSVTATGLRGSRLTAILLAHRLALGMTGVRWPVIGAILACANDGDGLEGLPADVEASLLVHERAALALHRLEPHEAALRAWFDLETGIDAGTLALAALAARAGHRFEQDRAGLMPGQAELLARLDLLGDGERALPARALATGLDALALRLGGLFEEALATAARLEALVNAPAGPWLVIAEERRIEHGHPRDEGPILLALRGFEGLLEDLDAWLGDVEHAAQMPRRAVTFVSLPARLAALLHYLASLQEGSTVARALAALPAEPAALAGAIASNRLKELL